MITVTPYLILSVTRIQHRAILYPKSPVPHAQSIANYAFDIYFEG